MEKTGVKIVAKNSKAFHEYFVEERFEAGIELFGTEVKSIRAGTLNLKDSYCTVKGGELFLHGGQVHPAWHPEPQGRLVQREGRRALGAADAYQPL